MAMRNLGAAQTRIKITTEHLLVVLFSILNQPCFEVFSYYPLSTKN